MIHVRGADSAIAQALAELVAICPVRRHQPMPHNGDRYLFCAGLLWNKKRDDQTKFEREESERVNYTQVVDACDDLLDNNRLARICVIGSEAVFTGSYDENYATAKTKLHYYVESKRLNFPGQQLVAIAPSIVLDTNMTNRRNEDGKRAMEGRRLKHPKLRWLQPMEVARLIHYLLYVDQGYISNTVVRMNGGEHCKMGTYKERPF